MLPFDGDAEQARKARKEIGIRKIELTESALSTSRTPNGR